MTELDAHVPTRRETVSDTFILRYFYHLTHRGFELEHRVPNRDWLIEYVTVPLSALHCCYSNPGAGDAPPAGLMGSVGWSSGQALGRTILDLAGALRLGLANRTAYTENASLAKVVAMRNSGVDAILAAEEPIAFVQHSSRWFVRDGMHRSVALCLLGRTSLAGVNLTTARQVD